MCKEKVKGPGNPPLCPHSLLFKDLANFKESVLPIL